MRLRLVGAMPGQGARKVLVKVADDFRVGAPPSAQFGDDFPEKVLHDGRVCDRDPLSDRDTAGFQVSERWPLPEQWNQEWFPRRIRVAIIMPSAGVHTMSPGEVHRDSSSRVLTSHLGMKKHEEIIARALGAIHHAGGHFSRAAQASGFGMARRSPDGSPLA